MCLLKLLLAIFFKNFDILEENIVIFLILVIFQRYLNENTIICTKFNLLNLNFRKYLISVYLTLNNEVFQKFELLVEKRISFCISIS